MTGRLMERSDYDGILFDGTVVPAGEIIGNMGNGLDIRGDINKTLFFSAIESFVVSVQLTDDDGDNPDWYDLADETSATGAARTYTLSGNGTDRYKRAISVPVKGVKMRVIARNAAAANSDTPYCGVI